MDIRYIKILILFGVFFSSLLTIAHYLPRFIIMWKAKYFKVKISLKEAYYIQKSRCADRSFFEGVKKIWTIKKIPIERLADHVISGGNLENIFSEMSENKNIDFERVAVKDLIHCAKQS